METGNDIAKVFWDHKVVKNVSGRQAMAIGMDFKGKTSSAAAKPPISGSMVVGFSGTSDGFSFVVTSFSVSSVEMVDLEVSKST